MFQVSQKLVLFVVAWSVICASGIAGGPRKWTSADGKYSIVGTMLSADDEAVLIQKENSKDPVRVPLAKLSESDRQYVTHQRKEIDGKLSPGPSIQGALQAGPDGKWLLNSQIKIDLPPGVDEWKKVVPTPPTFLAESKVRALTDSMKVECHPDMQSSQQRTLLLNYKRRLLVGRLESVGVRGLEALPELEEFAADRHDVHLDATLKDGTKVVSRLLVRFDMGSCIVFEMVGSPEFVNSAIEIANQIVYAGQKDMAAPASTSKVPADKEKSLLEFLAKVDKLLKDSDTKTLLETVVAPEELQEILKRVAMADLIEGMERGKKAELQAILEKLDWSRAEYNSQKKEIAFLPAGGTRQLIFVETELGWRMRN